jgi:hypothetical protein
MKGILGIFLIVAIQPVFANDYQVAKAYADVSKNNLEQVIKNLNPNDLISGYNPNPKESSLNPDTLKEIAKKEALKSEIAKDAIHRANNRKKVDLEQEGAAADKGIDLGQNQNTNGIPCSNGKCLPTQDEQSTDFAEGATELGALGGVADDVRKNQVRNGVPAIFSGSNNLCRVAASHVGNCCGGNAHLLNCREAEKALSRAKQDNRAQYVGTFCAHRKLRKCIEHKQSWCVFPTKLSSIIQIQGRFGQLHINFGQTTRKRNYANCRGITPEEISRIDFSRLDMRAVTEGFKNKYQQQDSTKQDGQITGHVNDWEKGGKWSEIGYE